MTEGAISMMGMLYGEHAAGRWLDQRESNIIDGGAHFYNTYQCADEKWIAIASIEAPFYRMLLEKAGIDAPEFADQMDTAQWPALKEKLRALFRTRTRDEWCQLMESTDVCFAPVLSLTEAPHHPHNVARGAFVEVDGVVQPAPMPRFSRTPGAVQSGPVRAGAHNDSALAQWGLSVTAIKPTTDE